jgi:hypothetical protein
MISRTACADIEGAAALNVTTAVLTAAEGEQG